MIFISHRGNLDGAKPKYENSPNYIDNALSKGFDCEIDIWVVNSKLYLGHDDPKYLINEQWLKTRISNIWIHCKNIQSLEYFSNNSNTFNYFWHQNDVATMTSKKDLWVYPGYQPIINSISVMPELNNENSLSKCKGICSDNIIKYKKKYENL